MGCSRPCGDEGVSESGKEKGQFYTSVCSQTSFNPDEGGATAHCASHVAGTSSCPGQTAADGEKAVRKKRLWRPERHRPPFSHWVAQAGSLVDRTPAPDRKEQHRVGRRERALRSFAPAISMMKATEPGTGDHRRRRRRLAFHWPSVSACPYRGNRESGPHGSSSRNRE
jgi:hypothetical protein